MKTPLVAPRGRHIGTPQNPGAVGGRINPAELDDNCVPCVAAVLQNKFNARGRDFYTAQRVTHEFNASVGRHVKPIANETQAIEYFERHLGLTSTFERLPNNFNAITHEGHYVLISHDHIIYGRVAPNGRRVLYDPQIDEVLSWEQAVQRLGSDRPSIHRIVREGGN